MTIDKRIRWLYLALVAATLVGACSLDYLPLGGTGRADCLGLRFRSPLLISEVSDPNADDWAPAVSADEQVLVFASWRAGSAGGSDLWMATRPAVDALFSAPEPLDELNSAGFESGPALSADALLLCFEATRDASSGDADLLWAERPDRSSPFSAPVVLGAVSSTSWESNCAIDRSALTILFTTSREANRDHDIWMATRPQREAPFGDPVPLAGVNTQYGELSPALSADSLELYFASNRPGGLGGYDIYYARRETAEGPFEEPVNLTSLNTENDDLHPAVSGDGRRLYLNRDSHFFGGPTKAQLWLAERLCESTP